MKCFAFSLIFISTCSSLALATSYDVISKNVGMRYGHFDVTGSRCWLRIWKNTQFNITTPPFDSVEFWVQFVRPANQLIATGIQPPDIDMPTRADPQTSPSNWPFDANSVQYRGVVSNQAVEADFFYDTTTSRINRIFLRKNSDRRSVDSTCKLE